MVPAEQAFNPNQFVLQIRGDRPLKGEVQISGSKNAALPIMAATLLGAGDCRVRNVPHLEDITQMTQLLQSLGVAVEHSGSVLNINSATLTAGEVPAGIIQQLGAGFLVIGPLLARLGMAQVPLPNGRAIGSSPVDLHLQGLEAMGANIEVRDGVVFASLKRTSASPFASGTHRLRGARIRLPFPSVGATETLIMAAVMAEGETVIENAAQEPEVVDLAGFCQSMGAQITGAGTSRIIISGVPRLHSADYRVIPDRIEAGTFLAAAAITRSPLTLNSVNPLHLRSVVEELWAMGATVRAEGSMVSSATRSAYRLKITPASHPEARVIKTGPYSGFPTDLQPQFMALLSTVEDNSLIIETLYENRFNHVPELNRLGANILTEGKQALVSGGARLKGAAVTATDLRAAAALVLAALAAEGTTQIYNSHHLNRGYENLESKLRQLGAVVERVQQAEVLPVGSAIAPPETMLLPKEKAAQFVAEVA